MELCSMLCASLDWRGFWGRIDVCMYMAESLRCLAETTTTLLIGYTSIQNKNFKVWKKQKKVKSGLWSQTKLDSGISLVFHCGGPGSITGVRTKILQMVWCGQKKKEKKLRKRDLLAKIGWRAAGLATRESSQVGYSLSCQVEARYSKSSELS